MEKGKAQKGQWKISSSSKRSPSKRFPTGANAKQMAIIQEQARRIRQLERQLSTLQQVRLKAALSRFGRVRGRTDGEPDNEPRVIISHSTVKGARVGELEEHWAAVRRVLELAGYEILVEGVERHGSVLKAWAIKRAKKKAKLLAEAAVMALNDNYVRKPGADASLTLAQAIQTMLETAGGHECLHILDNVVIGQRYGADGKLKQFSKELSLAERKAIAKNPAIVNEPSTFLQLLAESVVEEPEDAPATSA